MVKLVNFDAETLSSSLEDTQPRPEWALNFTLLAQYLYYSSLFNCKFSQTLDFVFLLSSYANYWCIVYAIFLSR